MTNDVWWGIFALGFVFGYLLYYAVRHTENFNIELLSSAIGAIGAGALIDYSKEYPGWIAPYGRGIGMGFLFYLFLSLALIWFGRGDVAGTKTVLLRRNLLGKTTKPD